MRLGRIHVVDVGREWAKRVFRDDVFGLAAELAYWFFLSLFPFFIFLAALGGFVAVILDVRDPTQQIVDLLGATMPPEATGLVRPQIEHVVGTRNPGLLSLGILGAIWTATGWASATIKAMNRAYAVRETRPFWQQYVLAFGLMLVTSSVLVGAFVLFVAGQVFGHQIAAAIGLEGVFQVVVNLARWPATSLCSCSGRHSCTGRRPTWTWDCGGSPPVPCCSPSAGSLPPICSPSTSPSSARTTPPTAPSAAWRSCSSGSI